MRKVYLTESDFQGSQVLSSLVLNPPYKFDGLTTSPRIPRTLTFPFGIRLDSQLLLKLSFQFILSMSSFMVISCALIFCFYLPVEKQNEQLTKAIKSLTNENYSLLANLEEVSSYNKLFFNAEKYSFKDAGIIFYSAASDDNYNKPNKKIISFNKYPSIQFSGF